MPLYDYRCAEGHVWESRQGVDCDTLTCPQCATSAQRIVTGERLPAITGFVARPTREARVDLKRYQEAQSEIIAQAEKHGVEPPDLFGAAKERVRRGDVQAIE